MGFQSDLKVLYQLTLKPVRGQDHAARLESFYGGQAEAYDDFRRRLLKGRQEMYAAIQPPPDAVWVDLGGGTGSNLEYVATQNPPPRKIYVVDLSPSLLRVARKRIAERGWNHVEAVEADATLYRPFEQQVAVVTFSYSLTMIPDWYAALENALALLKPGGLIGVVDFYVARKYPTVGMKKHSAFTRNFWPFWFAHDNVFLSPDHLPFLHRHFEAVRFEEASAQVPYLPFFRAPYYWFVGKKRF